MFISVQKRIEKAPGLKQQCGAVLVVSLVVLLMMTLIGVAAIESASMQVQMARNSLVVQKLYQASRSEIEAQYKRLNNLNELEKLIQIKEAEKKPGSGTALMPGAYGPSGDNVITSQLLSQAYGRAVSAEFSGEMGVASGYTVDSYVNKHFEIESSSWLTGSSVRSDQMQGLVKISPRY